MNLNRVFLSGNLGKDPERDNGGPAKFSLAVNDRWKDDKGEKQERTNWIQVVAWNGTADTAMQYLKKGAPVLVEGSLRTSEWDDKETGQKRYKTEVVASSVHFLGKKPAEQTTIADAPTTKKRK